MSQRVTCRRLGRSGLCRALLLVALLAPHSLGNPPRAQSPTFRALVFYKWVPGGHPHDSTAPGIQAIKNLGAQNNFAVDSSEDSAVFTDANLAQYKVVIFLNTAGEVLDDAGQAVMERYIRGGGNYVGIHSASWTERDWRWYTGLVGAWNITTAFTQTTAAKVEDRTHPSTSMLPQSWTRTDEWYNFDVNPRGKVRVLLTVDESTYTGGQMGADHPIAWCQVYEGSRSWYTSFGHTPESYSDPLFLQHVLGGIRWAAGAAVPPPLLLTEGNSNRAAALDSVTMLRAPFPLVTAHNFSGDGRTRITLLAANIDLAANEDTSVVTVQAEDAQQRVYPLAVEYVGKVPNAAWLTQVVVRLPDQPVNPGDLWVSIKLRDAFSNRALISVR